MELNIDEPVAAQIPAPAKPIIKAREQKIDFQAVINKTQIVPSVQDSGFLCKVCNQTFKDSVGYLDHINSKRHLMQAGLSLRIEKSSVEDVRQRILFWRDKFKSGTQNEEYDLQKRVEQLIKEEQEAAERRKIREKEKKRIKKEEEEAIKAEMEDVDVSAMMGFGSFGSSRK